jgi:hypothetical protein
MRKGTEMAGPSLEMRFLFLFAVGIGAFLIAYKSGNKFMAILIPAIVASICWMIPVLIDPKAIGAFGVIGLVGYQIPKSIARFFNRSINRRNGRILLSELK